MSLLTYLLVMGIVAILFISLYYTDPYMSFESIISMFEWATFFILPWLFLYWIVRFIKGYESKKTEEEQKGESNID